MRMPRVVAIVVLAAACASPLRASSVPSSNGVAFALHDDGAVVVPVMINGAGPFAFLLDTGSTHTSIGAALAARLAAPVVARARVITATGSEMSLVVRLGALEVGQSRADGILASVVPDGRLAIADRSVSGILGQDFLARFIYTLDYRHRRLSWDAGEADAKGAARLALRESQGRYLVELPQGRDRVVALVPDSGVDGLVVFERPGNAALTAEGQVGGLSLATVTGRRDVRLGRLRRLQIGAMTLWDQPVAIVRRPEADAPEGDGLLPLHLFASVSFNGRDGYLIVRSR